MPIHYQNQQHKGRESGGTETPDATRHEVFGQESAANHCEVLTKTEPIKLLRTNYHFEAYPGKLGEPIQELL